MKRRDAGLLLQGSLAHLSTPDLVQVLAVARKSGAIHFRAPADAGTLWIREGTIVDAQTDRLHRREAALEILSWTEGTFEVVFREVERADTIEEPTSTLLMTAMIAADEARANPALATQVPPATRRGFHPAWLLGAPRSATVSVNIIF